MSSSEVHISSMVVHVVPQQLSQVRDAIARLPGAEIHAESDEGKLVVVLETDDQTQIAEVIEKINDLDQVLSTALVYHQIEPS